MVSGYVICTLSCVIALWSATVSVVVPLPDRAPTVRDVVGLSVGVPQVYLLFAIVPVVNVRSVAPSYTWIVVPVFVYELTVPELSEGTVCDGFEITTVSAFEPASTTGTIVSSIFVVVPPARYSSHLIATLPDGGVYVLLLSFALEVYASVNVVPSVLW
jgi:hypothetical protein